MSSPAPMTWWCPLSNALLIAGRVPEAHTEVFRKAGHMPFMESTEQYVPALERAITDITQRSA